MDISFSSDRLNTSGWPSLLGTYSSSVASTVATPPPLSPPFVVDLLLFAISILSWAAAGLPGRLRFEHAVKLVGAMPVKKGKRDRGSSSAGFHRKNGLCQLLPRNPVIC